MSSNQSSRIAEFSDPLILVSLIINLWVARGSFVPDPEDIPDPDTDEEIAVVSCI